MDLFHSPHHHHHSAAEQATTNFLQVSWSVAKDAIWRLDGNHFLYPQRLLDVLVCPQYHRAKLLQLQKELFPITCGSYLNNWIDVLQFGAFVYDVNKFEFFNVESCRASFWHPDPLMPCYVLPRPGPDQKMVYFMAPTPDYIFPGLDRTETICINPKLTSFRLP